MTFSNITTSSAGSRSTNITIGAAGNNRVVIAYSGEARSPNSITAATLNGVLGTEIGTSDVGNFRSIFTYWLDADLPAAGTYTVTTQGFSAGTDAIAVIYAEGALQEAPTVTDPGGVTDTGTMHAVSASLAGASVEALAFIGFIKAAGALTPNAGQISVMNVQPGAQAYRAQASYEIGETSLGYAESFVEGFSSTAIAIEPAVTQPTTRKGSAFDIETTLGTITTATLAGANVFDHVTGQVGTTVSFAGAATDEITTSGEYTLTLGDGVGTENITVQVNVYGVAPSNNPVQKDGAALASLTGVQVRVTNGANINGTELYYSGTATTDASGNLSSIDLSSTAAADADPVLLHMRTAAGDSIIASETVGLI